MTDEKLLTIREVSLSLNISERQVIELAESGTVPAYKIGGVYLRFKRQEVEEYRKKLAQHPHAAARPSPVSFGERLRDFFYFNDFYIFSGIVIVSMLYIIFRG